MSSPDSNDLPHGVNSQYRLESTGGYYALLKRGDKQFRRSLKTKDRKLAEHRLADLRTKIDNLSLTVDAKVTFLELASKWLESIQHTIKPGTLRRMQGCVKNLTPFFSGTSVRNSTKSKCERWAVERGPKLAPQTFAHELMTMKGVFRYAVEKGFLIDNPAAAIKRKKIRQAEIQGTTRDQFQKLIAAIRFSDGRVDSQAKAQTGADLVELMPIPAAVFPRQHRSFGRTLISRRMDSMCVLRRTVSRELFQ